MNVQRHAWLIVALLIPVALLNYLDHQMLAAMKFSVMQDIPGIDQEANWGKILALFKWTYAILSPIGGYLSDRFSRRHVVAGSLFVWSFITWTTGHVQTYEQLLWTRAAMGVSEALYIPAALALIADFHNGPTRSKAVGLHQMGIYLGVILGGFSGYAADHPGLGWRWAFDLCGVIGLLYSIPLFFLLKNPVAEPGAVAVKQSPWGAARELLGNRSFVLLVLYSPCPPSPAGSCGTGCPPFSRRSSASARARPGFPPHSTGRSPRSSAPSSAARSQTAGCAGRTAAAFM